MSSSRQLSILRHACWLLLLVAYAVYKYLLGLQSWNFGHAVQVCVIVMLTAIIPYYVTVWNADPLEKLPRMMIMFLAPSLLSVLGYGLFYLAYVRPGIPGLNALQVMQSGLMPGIAISILLLSFNWWETVRSQALPSSCRDS